MLINLTNHPQKTWSKEQYKDIKRQYGKIFDMDFPFLDPEWDDYEKRIVSLVKEYLDKIIALKPNAVLLMGEWAFTVLLINELIKRHIKVISVAVNLDIKITHLPNGTCKRISTIHYAGLREYHLVNVK